MITDRAATDGDHPGLAAEALEPQLTVPRTVTDFPVSNAESGQFFGQSLEVLVHCLPLGWLPPTPEWDRGGRRGRSAPVAASQPLPTYVHLCDGVKKKVDIVARKRMLQ